MLVWPGTPKQAEGMFKQAPCQNGKQKIPKVANGGSHWSKLATKGEHLPLKTQSNAKDS